MRRLFLSLAAGVLSLGGMAYAATPARADHHPRQWDHGRWEHREHERWEHRRPERRVYHRPYDRPVYRGYYYVPAPSYYPVPPVVPCP